MPIYRYRCKCGIEFEKLILKNKEQIVICTICGNVPKRLIGKPVAHFKGNNFTKGANE